MNTQAQVVDKGRVLHQFYMDKTAARYVFKQGKVAEFHGGVYHTDIQSEIDELKAEINGGIGSIWQVPGQETVNSLDLDPVAVMKRKIIAEYEAEKARANKNGESTSDTGAAKPAGTGTVGVGAAVSNSGIAGAAKIVPGSIKPAALKP